MDMPYRRLLLATEHGEFDLGAETIAFALARRHALPLAAVMPLHSNPEFEATAPVQAARAEAQAAASRGALFSQAAAAGVTFDLQVRRGSELHAEIVAEARARNADLLVIRRRGRRSFLANLLVGEMVSQVVAHAPCSLLIAPRGAHLWSQGVLVGIDPQAPGGDLAVQAARVAAAGALPLTLVAVAAGPKDLAAAEEALVSPLSRARAAGAAARAEVRVGRIAEQLVAAAQAHGADLIVVGRRAGPTRQHGWHSDTAQAVVGASAGPVLLHLESPTH